MGSVPVRQAVALCVGGARCGAVKHLPSSVHTDRLCCCHNATYDVTAEGWAKAKPSCPPWRHHSACFWSARCVHWPACHPPWRVWLPMGTSRLSIWPVRHCAGATRLFTWSIWRSSGDSRLPARFRWSVWLLKWPVWLPSWSRWPSSSRWLIMDAQPASWPAWPRSWRTRCRVGAARLPSWAGDLPICSARLCTVEPRPSPGSVLSSRFRRFFTWPGCLQWLSAQLPSWSPRHSRLGGV